MRSIPPFELHAAVLGVLKKNMQQTIHARHPSEGFFMLLADDFKQCFLKIGVALLSLQLELKATLRHNKAENMNEFVSPNAIESVLLVYLCKTIFWS